MSANTQPVAFSTSFCERISVVPHLPPLIAIVLAIVTKEAYSSLFIGVVVGALFTTNFAPVAALDAVVNDGLIAAIAALALIIYMLFKPYKEATKLSDKH